MSQRLYDCFSLAIALTVITTAILQLYSDKISIANRSMPRNKNVHSNTCFLRKAMIYLDCDNDYQYQMWNTHLLRSISLPLASQALLTMIEMVRCYSSLQCVGFSGSDALKQRPHRCATLDQKSRHLFDLQSVSLPSQTMFRS